jgi:hypothetical protein
VTKQEYLESYPPLDRKIVEDVNTAMDACNLSGVVHAWSRWVSAIWNQANELGRGTDWVNQHPVNACVTDKLAQLACRSSVCDSDNPESIQTGWAYDWLAEQSRAAVGT